MKSADGRFEYLDLDGEPVAPGTHPMDVHRFAYICRACKKSDPNTKSTCTLNLGGRGHDLQNRNWQWDGNVDRPTLTPSIDCTGCFHGYLRNGQFVTVGGQPEPMQ